MPPALRLIRGDFAAAYAANIVGQLGNSLQFVAVLWYSSAAGPLGIVGVRVADTIPALLFGLHAGLVADRRPRRRTMIVANVVAGVAVTPLALLGLTGHVPVWALAAGGFTIVGALSYATPSFGAMLPALVGRARVQQANALLSGSNAVVNVAGQAFAAALLTAFSAGPFFAFNALSFVASALILTRLPRREPRLDDLAISSDVRPGFGAVRVRAGLRTAIATMALGMAVLTGIWTVGIVELARDRYHGASSLALLLMASAIGAIAATAGLARLSVRRKVFSSVLIWAALPLGLLSIAYAPMLPAAMAGSAVVGATSTAVLVLVTAAAQESVPKESLGRVLSLIFIANVGSKSVGLITLGPLFTFVGVTRMLDAGAATMLLAAIAGAWLVTRSAKRRLMLAAVSAVPAPPPASP